MEIKKQITTKFNDNERYMLTIFFERFHTLYDNCKEEYTDCNHCPFGDLCRIYENSVNGEDFIQSLEEEMSVVFNND